MGALDHVRLERRGAEGWRRLRGRSSCLLVSMLLLVAMQPTEGRRQCADAVSERVLRRAERGRTACTGRRVGTCVTRLAPTQPAVSMLLCVSMLLPAMLYAMQTRALVRSGMSRLVHAYACTRA